MSSWGHTLSAVTGHEGYECTACPVRDKKAAAHRATNLYITGRGGRVGLRARYLCDEHAEKFRAKYLTAEAVG